MAARILSISYDEALLLTRTLILQKAGYHAIPALGFVNAMEACRHGSFDVVIVGHSVPRDDKRAMLDAIRAGCNAPVVSLYKTSEGPLEGVDYALDGLEGPEVLLAVIRKALIHGRVEPPDNFSSAAD
jgi:DNA-binding response OmpR family regulator